MAEPTPAAEPVVEPTTTEKPAAHRENFDTMSIEDLKKIVEAPLERVNPPNKDAMKASLDAIDAAIKKGFERFEEIKAERQMIKEGFRVQNEARKESMEARKALFESRKVLSAKKTEALNEIQKVNKELEGIRNQIKDASRMKPEVIEEKISKAEHKIECESLTIAEEKDVQRDIKQWRKDLIVAKASSGLYERRDVLEAQKKVIKATLDEVSKELKDVYEKLGVKEEAPKKEEGEEKEKKENPFDKLNEEWKKVGEMIDEKRKEKKTIYEEFREKEKAFREFSFANKRRKAAQYALERKERELAEAELAKKEEEEELKKHPFEKEMNICDTLISYLKGLQVKEQKVVEKVAKEIVVPEGMTLLKKEEEVYFVAEPKKSKKSRKDGKTEKKVSNLIHNLSTLESFAAVRVAAPKTVEEVKECLTTVLGRKEFFDKLPRGSNVDEELAKSN